MKPATVIFACVHNAGRSQMAAALFELLADPAKARAISAGTQPGERVHPEVVQVMREDGLDLASRTPRLLTSELANAATMLVTMGCGETCPVVPGVERRDTTLVLPARDHLELDLHLLPNGNARAESSTRVRLGDGSLAEVFDDAYRLVDEPGAREFALEGPPSDDRDAPARRLSITFDEWYPYAQVYAPGDQDFVAIEPMTAPANALLTHDYRVVPPGESHSASFTVRVDPLDPDPEPDPLAEPGSPPLET